jgi:hypothetical protein
MFTRRAAVRIQPATTTFARRAMSDAERAGVSAGVTSGLLTGSPMTALLVGGGTLLAYGIFSRNRGTI